MAQERRIIQQQLLFQQEHKRMTNRIKWAINSYKISAIPLQPIPKTAEELRGALGGVRNGNRTNWTLSLLQGVVGDVLSPSLIWLLLNSYQYLLLFQSKSHRLKEFQRISPLGRLLASIRMLQKILILFFVNFFASYRKIKILHGELLMFCPLNLIIAKILKLN